MGSELDRLLSALRSRKSVRTQAHVLSAANDPAHLDPDEIADYLSGSVRSADMARIEGHLATCDLCLGILTDIAAFAPYASETEARPVSGASREPGPEQAAPNVLERIKRTGQDLKDQITGLAGLGLGLAGLGRLGDMPGSPSLASSHNSDQLPGEDWLHENHDAHVTGEAQIHSDDLHDPTASHLDDIWHGDGPDHHHEIDQGGIEDISDTHHDGLDEHDGFGHYS